MIVPSSKLLFWTGVIVLPFALMVVVAPASAPLAGLIIAGFIVVAAVDAAGGPRRLGGIAVELAPVVRLTKGRPARLELRVHQTRPGPRSLRVALPWPPEIQPETGVVEVRLPAAAGWSRLAMGCTPGQRGRFRLDRAWLETPSRLGWWAARAVVPVNSELRVYPSLLAARKSLAAIFLNRGAFGLHAQRQVGKGRDFEKLRDYAPGDGYDEIHWKATARRGKPITKVFQVERTQEVYVLLDYSRLTARPAARAADGEGAVLDSFVTAALALGLAAETQGDCFGLLTFADRVTGFVRARNGPAHFRACRDTLHLLQPRVVTPDFDELCTFIRLRLRRRALLVVLTALDDPALAESFAQNVERVRRQHLVLVHAAPPGGVRPLFSGPPPADLDGVYAQLGGHLQWQRLRELQKVLQRINVRLSLAGPAGLSTDVVTQYMSVKQRQLL